MKIALVGNPNSGKTTLFNALTGSRQKVGNFPGVTVERISGQISISGEVHTLVDLPGTYSLHPTSEDERIVASILLNPEDQDFPDLVVYVLDYKSLEQQLLMLSQIIDLGLPIVLAITMSDEVAKEGYKVNLELIQKKIKCPVILVSGRQKKNLEALKDLIKENLESPKKTPPFYRLQQQEQFILEAVLDEHKNDQLTTYGQLLCIEHSEWLPFLSDYVKKQYQKAILETEFNPIRSQVHETMARFEQLSPLAEQVVKKKQGYRSWTDKIDNIVSHPWIGPAIFIVVMLLVFQAIYAWASYPMDFIEFIFAEMGSYVRQVLPAEAWYTQLLTDGILAGLSGVLVFIPQIAILFFLLGLLEEVGYMSRAVYLFDRFMSRFGLNGRSVVAMVSGGACAIPAIMSTRTIANRKERLLTILVTPFIACSARIPVYTVLVGFVVARDVHWGPFNAQGLVFMGLYVFGIVAALASALLLRPIVGGQTSGFLMIELPNYRSPNWKSIGLEVRSKVGSFVKEAGKIIFAISIVLWVIASYGPADEMENARAQAFQTAQEQQLDEQATANLIASNELEASYAGHLGKFIEPAIQPLGFDWKIGISLLTSFAAREVFVGTMATIYSIGDAEDEFRVRDKMAADINPTTGQPTYNLATSLSLLIFFALAMQCMSTLAVVKKETGSWKWPIFQFIFMTGAAYILSWITFQLFQ